MASDAGVTKPGGGGPENLHRCLHRCQLLLEELGSAPFTLVSVGQLDLPRLRAWRAHLPQAKMVHVSPGSETPSCDEQGVAVEPGAPFTEGKLAELREKYPDVGLVVDDGSHRYGGAGVTRRDLLSLLMPGGFLFIDRCVPNLPGGEHRDDPLAIATRLLEGSDGQGEVVSREPAGIDFALLLQGAVLVRKSGTALHFRSYEELGVEQVLSSQPRSSVEITIPEVRGESPRPASVVEIPLPPDYLVRLRGAVCVPRQLLLKGSAVLLDSFRHYEPRAPHGCLQHEASDRYAPLLPVQPQEFISEPCFFLDTEHHNHYGHLTLEALSRLWALEHLDVAALKFVTSTTRRLALVQTLLQPLGVEPEQVIQLRSPTWFQTLLVAKQAYVLGRSVSPNAFKVWSRIGEAFAKPGTPDRIYVSRLKWTKQRNLRNEEEIAALFERRGFAVVAPEDLPIGEQISLFAQATTIAGPVGSGLYGCVYSRPPGMRIILAPRRFIKLNDALVNQQNGSRIVYLAGDAVDDRDPMLADWWIDPELVDTELSRLLS